MALVVEDGTGIANANSYASTAAADTYFSDRGNTVWGALATPAKEAALINATAYIDTKNYGKFKGQIEFPDTPQALQFPRTGMANVPDGLPTCVVSAAMEYAVRASAAPLAPDPTVDATGRLYIKSLEKVGPLTEEYDYAAAGPLANPFLFKPYPFADAMLRPVLIYAGAVIRN